MEQKDNFSSWHGIVGFLVGMNIQSDMLKYTKTIHHRI